MENKSISKRGRPRKRQYNQELLTRELLDTVTKLYMEKHEIKPVAAELSMPPHKVKKLLITNRTISYPETDRIQKLLKDGKSMKEIQRIMGMGYSTIHTYLPYTKVVYHLPENSQNAERAERYRKRKKEIAILAAEPGFGNLWKAVDAFQDYSFTAANGLKFSYTLKDGGMFIEKSAVSIRKADAELAYKRAVEMNRIVKDSKKLGVFGADYLYPVFVRIGVIQHSEKRFSDTVYD